MNSNLYRLVYCSRNRLQGGELDVTREIQHILATARANNAKIGISGALMYNDGNFAQILEGPLASIEHIFEKIQRDPRHSEITVVQSGRASERLFPAWSMAFAGTSGTDRIPAATAAFRAAFENVDHAGDQLLSVLQELVIQEDENILLDAEFISGR